MSKSQITFWAVLNKSDGCLGQTSLPNTKVKTICLVFPTKKSAQEAISLRVDKSVKLVVQKIGIIRK